MDEEDGFDAAEIDKEIVNSRLKQDVLQHSGKVHLFVADSYFSPASPPDVRILELKKGHHLPLTAVALSGSGRSVWTSGKEGSIVKWDARTGKRLNTIHKARKGKGKEVDPVVGHSDEVLALAVSGDGKYLVSAGRDRKIVVWDSESMTMIKEFWGSLAHRDAVSVCFVLLPLQLLDD